MKKTGVIKYIVVLFALSIIFTSCSRKIVKIVNDDLYNEEVVEKEKEKKRPSDPIEGAEFDATPSGKKVLSIGRTMVYDEKKIVKGSCWDYIHEVYNRAGYPIADRKTVFKSKKKGPYADIDMIQPGDWLYYINHSYHGVEHSGIFVYWKDKKNKIGVTLSYGGQNRNEPGRYKEYDLRSVYNIMRPND
jgi:hypothetical protein